MATTEAASKLSVASRAWLALYKYFKAQAPRFAELSTEFDMSSSQGYAMYLLDEPMSMGELAQRLVCDNSNVTGIVDRLEARGLIERRPSPTDRRVKLLVLTDAGRELRRRGLELLAKPTPGIASLTVAEQRALRDLLRKAFAAEQG